MNDETPRPGNDQGAGVVGRDSLSVPACDHGTVPDQCLICHPDPAPPPTDHRIATQCLPLIRAAAGRERAERRALAARVRRVEDRVGSIGALAMFPTYPLAEIVDTIEWLARIAATETKPDPGEPRMIRDYREQAGRGTA